MRDARALLGGARKPVYDVHVRPAHPPTRARRGQARIRAAAQRAVVCASPRRRSRASCSSSSRSPTRSTSRRRASRSRRAGRRGASRRRRAGSRAARPAARAQGRPGRCACTSRRTRARGRARLPRSGRRPRALIIDEVDLVLQPAQVGGNWPRGVKEPLDRRSPSIGRDGKRSRGGGLRWQCPFHLLDGVLRTRPARCCGRPRRASRRACRASRGARSPSSRAALDAGRDAKVAGDAAPASCSTRRSTTRAAASRRKRASPRATLWLRAHGPARRRRPRGASRTSPGRALLGRDARPRRQGQGRSTRGARARLRHDWPAPLHAARASAASSAVGRPAHAAAHARAALAVDPLCARAAGCSRCRSSARTCRAARRARAARRVIGFDDPRVPLRGPAPRRLLRRPARAARHACAPSRRVPQAPSCPALRRVGRRAGGRRARRGRRATRPRRRLPHVAAAGGGGSARRLAARGGALKRAAADADAYAPVDAAAAAAAVRAAAAREAAAFGDVDAAGGDADPAAMRQGGRSDVDAEDAVLGRRAAPLRVGPRPTSAARRAPRARRDGAAARRRRRRRATRRGDARARGHVEVAGELNSSAGSASRATTHDRRHLAAAARRRERRRAVRRPTSCSPGAQCAQHWLEEHDLPAFAASTRASSSPACGQERRRRVLTARRLGFSGTPSACSPVALGVPREGAPTPRRATRPRPGLVSAHPRRALVGRGRARRRLTTRARPPGGGRRSATRPRDRLRLRARAQHARARCRRVARVAFDAGALFPAARCSPRDHRSRRRARHGPSTRRSRARPARARACLASFDVVYSRRRGRKMIYAAAGDATAIRAAPRAGRRARTFYDQVHSRRAWTSSTRSRSRVLTSART